MLVVATANAAANVGWCNCSYGIVYVVVAGDFVIVIAVVVVVVVVVVVRATIFCQSVLLLSCTSNFQESDFC